MPDPKVPNSQAKSSTPKGGRAKVTTIDFGSFQVQGFLAVDASFAVSLSLTCPLFQSFTSNYLREVKALMGKGFQSFKMATEINPKAVDCISLPQLETLILRLIIEKKDARAIEFAELAIGMTLNQRFSDAFGVKFDKEERDAWFQARAIGIFERNNLTDGILRYLKANPERSEAYQKFVYPNCSDALNLALTGQKAKYWRDSLGLDKNGLRDVWSEKMLDRLKTLEELAGRKIDKGLEPLEAVKAAIEAIDYPVLPVDKLFKPNPTA